MFPGGGGGNGEALLIIWLLGSPANGGPLGPLTRGTGGGMKPGPAVSHSVAGVLGTVEFPRSLLVSLLVDSNFEDTGPSGGGAIILRSCSHGGDRDLSEGALGASDSLL